MNTITVKTTQNVALEYPIASIGDRILAYLIDIAVFIGWMITIGMLMAFSGIEQSAGKLGPVFFILMVVMMVPMLFYSLLCEIFLNGQTIGKRAKDIKVIKLSGAAPSIGDYLLRWLFRLIDISICYGVIAMITIAVTGRGQRLGDLAAGTSVIRTRAVRRNVPFAVKPEENYMVSFPEVSLLTDADMALIRKLLFKALNYRNYTLLAHVAQRTKEAMQINSDLNDEQFLRTVIKDYHHVMTSVEV